MTEDLYQAIFSRKSVRKFEQAPLDEGTMAKLRTFLGQVKPMFPDIRTELVFLEGDSVKGMFKVAAPHYLAIFSEEKGSYAANAGFILQQVDLFLSANGVGCCWQGGPKPTRKAPAPSGLEFMIMIAFGRPAEEVHRKSVAEFKREPLGESTKIEGMDDMLEPARLAPSGMNNQSWYFTGGDGIVHGHSAGSMVLDRMNRINVGIAMCHMWLAAAHAGKSAEFYTDRSPAAAPPKGFSYVASMALK
jgi:nitroreductase